MLIIPLSSVAQENFNSLNEKGNSSIEKQNYSEALAFFKKAIEMGTDNKNDLVYTSSIAGICAQKIDDSNQAIFFFGNAINNGCKEEDIYERYFNLIKPQKDLVKEEFAMQQARKNIPEASGKYTVMLLNFYFNHQYFDKVVQIANEPMSGSVNQSQVVTLKAISLAKLGKMNEAIESLENFIKSNPDSYDASKQLGLIYYDSAFEINTKAKNDYKSIKKPPWTDYNLFLQKEKKSMEQFKKALPNLEKGYQIKADEILKKALYNTYIKLGNNAKANLYK